MIITCPKCSATYQIPDEVHLSDGKKMKCSNCSHVFLFENTEEVGPQPDAMNDTQTVIDVDPVMPEENSPILTDEPVLKEDVPQPFLPVAVVEPKHHNSVGLFAAIISFAIVVVLLGIGFVYRDTLRSFMVDAEPVVPQPMMKPVINQPVKDVRTEPVTEVFEKKVSSEEYVEETPEIVLLPQIQSVRFEKRLDPEPTIRIEGVLRNNSSKSMRLPAKVRAVAYSSEGTILFEKEIFLTDSILPANTELSFFGSYQPAPDGVQWVDVTF